MSNNDENNKFNEEDLPIDDFDTEGVEIASIGDHDIKPKATESKIELTEAEMKTFEKYKSDYLYLQAEFDNYKRRAIKERSDLIKYGSEPFVNELLSVLDVFDMALAQEVTPENLESFKQGMEMTHVQLNQSLEKFNITVVGKVGDKFDPNKHEALTQEPTNEVAEGHILRVFKKGYRFHEKIIRPAQVVVAAAASSAESDGGEGL